MRLLRTLLATAAILVTACGGAAPEPETAPPTEPAPAPREPAPDPEPAPADPTPPAPGVCEAEHYSTCPPGCVTQCVGSCPACDDCDGPGSCRAP
ncbi:MAG: hypothetical protein KC619_08175 [Myxococcales bacterium]|nr:hypothetical protein [Myxococcales bacterium]